MSEPIKENRPIISSGGAHVAKPNLTKSNSAQTDDVPKSDSGAAAPVPAPSSAAAPKRNKYADKMNRKKKKKKGPRIIAAVIVIATIAGGVYYYMTHRQDEETDAIDANTTAVVSRGMLETYIEGDGTTAAKKREELGKDLKGKVSKVLVEVGDEVKKNQELVVINPTETREELQAAEQELEDAQRAVTEAQDAVTKAQSQVNAAQKNLGKLRVTAPFSGQVIPVTDGEGKATEYKVGQQISSGETIGYMVDDSTMNLSLFFSSAYSDEIVAGQAASVSIPSAMSTVSGTVSSVEQSQRVSADGVRMFRVIVSVPNPGTLTKDMSATATITTSAGEVYPVDSGTLEYSREEAITAQVGGEISSVGGLDYYSYTSGATIMSLTSDSAQDELQDAQSSVTSARTQVANAQKTVSTKQQRVTELNKLINNSTIKSPIDGVVVSLDAVEGSDISGSTPLVVVADLNDIIVNANITATDVPSVEPGQMATMSMYLPDGEVMLTGVVESVSMEANQDQNGGQGSMPTFPAVISLDPVDGQTLRSGYPVQYRITTATSMDCLIVPSSAVVNTENGTAVFAKPMEGETFDDALPMPEGTDVPPDFVLVPVEVGISDSSNTEILWGIDEGTTVYLAGPEDLYADMGGDGTSFVG